MIEFNGHNYMLYRGKWYRLELENDNNIPQTLNSLHSIDDMLSPNYQQTKTVKKTDNMAGSIYNFKNRDNITLSFVRTGEHTVFFTGYGSLQVTGEESNIIAIDPSGGPLIEKGNDICNYWREYDLEYGTGKIYKIEVLKFGTLLTIL